jgi:hypothetical protein
VKKAHKQQPAPAETHCELATAYSGIPKNDVATQPACLPATQQTTFVNATPLPLANAASMGMEDNMGAILSLLASDHGAGWFASQQAAQQDNNPALVGGWGLAALAGAVVAGQQSCAVKQLGLIRQLVSSAAAFSTACV